MSGVEVAGLILGAFPLMITALEHYRDTAEVLEGWWKIKREYLKCMRNLKYHKLAFEENLEELLLPLIADEDKLQLLLEEPGGQAWKEQELEDMLKERMPKTYSSYLDTVEEMLETVQALEDALGMNKVHFRARVTTAGEYMIEKTPSGSKRAIIAHVTSIGMQNIEFQTQRIKLAFNKAGRQQLFEDFGSHNSRLRDILGSSDRLAGLRQARVSKSSVNAGLWKFWNHGNTLFNLLTEAWSCKCQPLHHANLLLQHRAAPTVNFRVVFWFKKQLVLGQPWTWQDTSIKLLEEASKPAVITIHVPPVMNGTSNGQMPVPVPSPIQISVPSVAVSPLKSSQNVNGKDPNKSSRRSFMDKFKSNKTSKSLTPTPENKASTSPTTQSPAPTSPALTPTTSTTSTTSTSPPTEPATPKPKPKVSFIDPCASPSPTLTNLCTNLCTKITTCTPSLPVYGILQCHTHQYTIQPLHSPSTTPLPHLTLSTLLSPSSPLTITRRQRLQIALILASSHVQLHPTPWISARWCKSDILFLCDGEGDGKVGLERPYLSRSIAKSLDLVRGSDIHFFQESVRGLGILLLELCFGTAIEDHKLLHDVTAPNEQMRQLLNYTVAREWARDVLEEAGPEYSDAVDWCLHHVPDCETGEGKEERWREDMYVKVVEPLKYCHDQLLAVQKGMGG